MQMRENLEEKIFFENTKAPIAIFFYRNSCVKVTKDWLIDIKKTESTFYFGLDLSAVFDFLDHEILFLLLETILGLKDKGLSFFNSYLSSRLQKVLIDGE